MRQTRPSVMSVDRPPPTPFSGRIGQPLPLGAGTFVRAFHFPATRSCGHVSLPSDSERSPGERCRAADWSRGHHLGVHGRRQRLERERRRQGQGGRKDATKWRRQARRTSTRADRRQAAATNAASAMHIPIPSSITCSSVVEAAAQMTGLKRRWQRNGGRQYLAASGRGARQETPADTRDTTAAHPDTADGSAGANGAAPSPSANTKIRKQRLRGGGARRWQPTAACRA